jgi:hypothetical protein
MSRSRLLWIPLLLLGLLLAACSNSAATPVLPANAAAQAPTPLAGRSGMIGQILNSDTNTPAKQASVYLATVVWNPQRTEAAYYYDLARSPVAFTNDEGIFTFNDLEPNEYVMLVGDYYTIMDVIRATDGTARVHKLEAGQVFNAGSIPVNPAVPQTR